MGVQLNFSVALNAKLSQQFLKIPQPLGRSLEAEIIQYPCDQLAKVGTGTIDSMTRRGIGGTVVTILMDSGEDECFGCKQD